MPKQHLPHALPLAADGVLTREQLVAAELNPDLGDRLVRGGAARRLAPSTYLLGAEPAEDAQLVVAALAHAGDDAVVTGLLGCRLLGLTDAVGGRGIHVLIPAGRRRVSTDLIRVQPTRRPAAVWEVDGVRVAEPHRAVVDAARRMRSLRDARALVLGAVAARWCSPERLRAELDAGPRNGTALCRAAIGDAEGGAWSAPEAEVADIATAAVRRGQLPAFLLNPTLLVDGTVVGQPDGWLPGLGLGWEVDSRRHHGSDDDFDSTLARHDRFAGHGLQLLHVTPRRARQLGSAYAQVLVAAAEARRRSGPCEPSGLVVRPYDAAARPLRTRPAA